MERGISMANTSIREIICFVMLLLLSVVQLLVCAGEKSRCNYDQPPLQKMAHVVSHLLFHMKKRMSSIIYYCNKGIAF